MSTQEMTMRKNNIFSLIVAGSLSVGGTGWALTPQEKEKEKPELKVTAVVVNHDDEEKKTIQLAELAPNKLWLGVGLKSIEGDLSEFLGSDKGVLVEDVQENSPAGKAGLLKGDLLLSVDGTELNGPNDLLTFMKSAKEGEALTLKLRRKNEEKEIKVTPELRPKELKMSFDLGKEIGDGDFQFHFDPSKMEVFRMGNPAGIFVPQGLPKGDLSLNFSSNKDGKSVEVKVVRKGENPAEITVTKDGETQTYTEDQLDEVPEDVRNWIGSMIKPGKRSIFGLSQLGDLRKLEGLKLDTHHLQSHLDALMKDSTLPQSAKEAIQRALGEATAGAEQAKAAAEALNSPELRKQLDGIRTRVADEAKEAIKKAMADAQKKGQKSAKSESKEIEELRELVGELKKEIAELRAASQKEKSNK
jgi:PDZ domain